MAPEIFARGISEQGKKDVIEAHNKYRLDIAEGRVPGQPKGTNLLTMEFDEILSKKARVVTDQCKMQHVVINDERWSDVGQNLYMSFSSRRDDKQDWHAAVTCWFNEHKDFIYPTSKKPGTVTGHYTQVVWADSKYVGCDFISFYDQTNPSTPYAKLYVCNYGPAGNYLTKAPYETNGSGNGLL